MIEGSLEEQLRRRVEHGPYGRTSVDDRSPGRREADGGLEPPVAAPNSLPQGLDLLLEARLRRPGQADLARESEAQQPNLLLGGPRAEDEDLVGGEVAVDEALSVGSLEGLEDLTHQASRARDAERALADQVAEGVALDEVHDDVETLGRSIEVDLVDRDYVGVTEAAASGVGARVQELERIAAALALGQVELGSAPPREPPLEPVAPTDSQPQRIRHDSSVACDRPLARSTEASAE